MAANRWPGVYKRGNTWSFRAQFEADGQRWGVSGGGYGTAKQASAARSKAISNGTGKKGAGSESPLADYLTSWLSGHSETLRPGSASTYAARISSISSHPLAKKKLGSLTEADYRKMIGDWQKGVSHATLVARVGLLRTALAAAVRAGILTADPLKSISFSRATAKFESTIWDRETALRFLAQRKDDPLYDVWHLALVAGLRRGELHGLKRDDLDLEKGLLYVRRQRSDVRGRVVEGPPKTEGSEAPVHLDAETCSLLRLHDWTLSDYLVTDPASGRPYKSMSTFLNHWAKACLEAGVPRIRFHDLRHTSASLLAAAGVPLSAAQHRLRHWSPRMTQAYTQVADSTGRETAAKIGALLSQGALTGRFSVAAPNLSTVPEPHSLLYPALLAEDLEPMTPEQVAEVRSQRV